MGEVRGPSLTAQTATGIRWSYLGTTLTFVLQIVWVAISARLLAPADFGVMALATLVLALLTHFSQLGIGSAIVQREEISQSDIRVAFTVSAFLGFVSAALVAVLAPVAASILGSDGLTPVLRATGAAFLFSGIGAPSIALLRRTLRFRALITTETLAYLLAYLGVGLVAALSGLGVWSLVLAWVSQPLFTSAIAYGLVRHGLRPLADRARFRHLYGFGSRVSIIGFLEFLTLNTDTFAVGRFAGTANLGQYSRASLLVGLPLHQLTANLGKVVLPGLSRIQREPERLVRAFTGGLALATGLVFPLWAAMSVLANDLVYVLLGQEWGLAAALVPIVGLAQAFEMSTYLPALMGEAVDALRAKLAIQGFYLFLVAVGVSVVVWRDGGVFAFASVWAGVYLLRHLTYVVYMSRRLGAPLGRVVTAHLQAFVLAALTAAGVQGAWHLPGIGDADAVLRLVAGGSAGALVLIACVLFTPALQVREELVARRLLPEPLLDIARKAHIR